MKHWRAIEGWWEDEWLFQEIVASAPDRSVFVEVGSWMGRSTACMAQAIKASGKDIGLWAVDTFEGSSYGSHPAKVAALEESGTTLFAEFIKNMVEARVISLLCPLSTTSVRASRMFSEHEVWSVFIDADHRPAAVTEDVQAWLPKIKPGGWLCGHDWPTRPDSPQMVRAGVLAALNFEPESKGMVWWHRIPR